MVSLAPRAQLGTGLIPMLPSWRTQGHQALQEVVGAPGRSLRPPWDLSAMAALQQGCGARPYRGGDGAAPGTAWMERLSPDTAACQVCG